MRRALAKPGDRLEVHIKASVIAIQFIRPPPPRDPSAGKGHVFGPATTRTTIQGARTLPGFDLGTMEDDMAGQERTR